MGVENQHKDYTAMCNKWQRCIDVAKGPDAVLARGPTYLPKLSEQSEAEYLAYKTRTIFYNATWRTIVGLQGMLFRKPPKIVVPELVKDMLEDINLSGTSMHIFALTAAEECLKLGRLGIYVDYPVVEVGATRADAIVLNHRPSMKLYSALSIINWKTKTINNKTCLSMVVLKEAVDVAKDEFTDEELIQYRVLDLMESNGKYIYRVRIFVKDKEGKDLQVGESVFPKIAGKSLEYIPFQFVGVDDVSWTVDEPPLIDLVDVNLSHYRTTADYEHGCHFTGLPTPIVSGYTADSNNPEKFCIGSTTAWVFPRPDAKAFFLEFTGAGLSALKDNLERKEGYMAILGARMLEVNVKGGVESANTAALHRGGEQSMLSSVSQAISMGIAKALKIFCEFAGVPTEKVEFLLNRDFFPVPMDALTLTSIIAGWQNGAYSYDSMLALLQKGEMVDPDKTVEDEIKLIEKNPYVPPLDPNVAVTPGEQSPKAKATDSTPAPTGTQLRNGSK
jgi:hypothetical protein